MSSKGYKHSDEAKKKISLAAIGKKYALGSKHTDEWKKKMSGRIPWNKGRTGVMPPVWNKGKKLSEQHKKNLRVKHPSSMGINHPNWKGGVTEINTQIRKSFEYKLWREAVFARDKYTCIWCGQVRGNINADHIKRFSDYPELRFAIDNGRTLCETCHKTTDNYGTRGWLKKKTK